MSPRIYTKCPACGNDTLTINDDKHLLCTWIQCPAPTLIDKVSELAAEHQQLLAHSSPVAAETGPWERIGESLWRCRECRNHVDCINYPSHWGHSDTCHYSARPIVERAEKAEAELAQAKSDLAKEQRQSAEHYNELDTLHHRLSDAKSEVERLKTEAARTKGTTDFEIADRDVSIEDMTHRIGALESALSTARAQLTEEEVVHGQTVLRLGNRISDGELEIDSLRSRLAEVEHEHCVRTSEAIGLKQDLDSLRAQLEAVTKERDEADDMLATAAEVAKRSTLKEKVAALTAALAAAEGHFSAIGSIANTTPNIGAIERHVKAGIAALRAQQPQGGGKE